ncbi:pyridoxamine 5'-phosphate oxidase family protein [Agromyces sp. SYSU K20354]|uniref:pyridoxamine 5'-phosphate oxidase family protein n=1 Tax=Agromyces cavernae TaxID=2898659 RepID=UPI001E54BFD4|nr:pyridoxamine 5'-phosphate oxidase family protein [Agromyces cavernae]MCD2443630.1 pyridoxamine 5'-phosphate oxidase family protein [Agromyces cavernae]
MVDLTSETVWNAIRSANFMVVGMVSAKGEARTAGVMHHVDGGRLWFTTNDREWKARHIAANPAVSVTVPIAKRVPFVPWVKVPAATITFRGEAEVMPAADLPDDAKHALLHGLEVTDGGERGALIAIGVRPVGDFVTYGIGVSLLGMRDTELARGRVPAAVLEPMPAALPA